MTNLRFDTSSEKALDLAGISRGLLASLCFLGLSSTPNSGWLVVPAVGVFAHTFHNSGALRRPASWALAWRFVGRWGLRMLGAAGVFAAAGLLSDGPGALAILGSLIFLAGIVIVAVTLASATVRAAVATTPRIANIAKAVIEGVRFHLRLAWMSIAR